MKKTLAILMAIILIFSFAACKSNGDDLTSSGAPVSDGFNVPDNYSVVLLVSINPQIKLYLDENGIVLALEAVNDDTKQIVDEIEYKNTDFEKVIKSFVSIANSNGFIKSDAKIDFEILENKASSLSTSDILNNAAAAAKNAADEIKITLSTNIINTTNTDAPANTDDTPNETNSKVEETDNSKNNTVNNEPLNTHKHSFTQATCKAPKTCKECGATEGEKGEHTFVNGVCSVCGHTNILNPKNDLVILVEYVGNLKVSGDMLIGGALQFEGDSCVVVERYFNSQQSDPAQTPIVFEGKKYYSEGGGQTPHHIELTDTEIIIKGSLWGDAPYEPTIRLVLQGDGMLKVTSSTNSLFPVGAVFSTNINDVLK